jgi:predicted RNA methylase
VNKVQLDIRQGHAQTVDKVLKWFDEEGGLQGASVADCGCGTGGCGPELRMVSRAAGCRRSGCCRLKGC